MCQIGWGVDGEAWRWRRMLFALEEEMFGEFILLLHNVSLKVDKDDRWLWTLETSQAFSVCSVYKFLTAQPHVDSPVAVASLWHKDVPLKVVLFVWRFFRDRLPTKDNLLRHGVIYHAFRACVTGYASNESSGHLFLHCKKFCSVWHFIYSWLGISSVAPRQVPDHFNQFSFILLLLRCGARFFRLSGLLPFGKFEKKETIGFSTRSRARLCRWLTRLSRFLLCRWRRNLLRIPSFIMVGGLVRSPCWA